MLKKPLNKGFARFCNEKQSAGNPCFYALWEYVYDCTAREWYAKKLAPNQAAMNEREHLVNKIKEKIIAKSDDKNKISKFPHLAS